MRGPQGTGPRAGDIVWSIRPLLGSKFPDIPWVLLLCSWLLVAGLCIWSSFYISGGQAGQSLMKQPHPTISFLTSERCQHHLKSWYFTGSWHRTHPSLLLLDMLSSLSPPNCFNASCSCLCGSRLNIVVWVSLNYGKMYFACRSHFQPHLLHPPHPFCTGTWPSNFI